MVLSRGLQPLLLGISRCPPCRRHRQLVPPGARATMGSLRWPHPWPHSGAARSASAFGGAGRGLESPTPDEPRNSAPRSAVPEETRTPIPTVPPPYLGRVDGRDPSCRSPGPHSSQRKGKAHFATIPNGRNASALETRCWIRPCGQRKIHRLWRSGLGAGNVETRPDIRSACGFWSSKVPCA